MSLGDFLSKLQNGGTLTLRQAIPGRGKYPTEQRKDLKAILSRQSDVVCTHGVYSLKA